MRHSTARPLFSLSLYLRHRRRALILMAVMVLMTLGVSFRAFLLAPRGNALIPFAGPLRAALIMAPRAAAAVDTGVGPPVRSGSVQGGGGDEETHRPGEQRQEKERDGGGVAWR